MASADFFFNDVQNEPFAEQLREKKRFLDEQVRRRRRQGASGGGAGGQAQRGCCSSACSLSL